MASPTRWTWIWMNSGRWWWTGRPGVLRFMKLPRVGHDWVTELNWTELILLGVSTCLLKSRSCVLVSQSCLTLCDPMDCSPPGCSVHGILQERKLEWAAVLFSRVSSQSWDWTRVSHSGGWFFFFFFNHLNHQGSPAIKIYGFLACCAGTSLPFPWIRSFLS